MTAPASGVVIAQTSSYSYEGNGSRQNFHSASTYCTVSGYGTISTGNNYEYAIVNKGTTITLVHNGYGAHATGHATFYPFK